jgi:hypothetical protein
MSLRRVLSVALTVAMSALVVVVVLARPTQAHGLDFQSFSASVSGSGGNFFYNSNNATVTAGQLWYGDYEQLHIGVTAKTGGSDYVFDFATLKGSGQRFVTRDYQWAQDYNPFSDPGRPGINVYGDGDPNGCGQPQTGNFEVRDIARSGLTITRLWLVWARWCGDAFGGGSWVEFGELRLGYPQAAYDVSPRVVVWPSDTTYPGDAGQAVPVQVRATSSAAVTAGTPSVSGADAGDFPIRQQDCTGTLTASGCTVWVGFNPSAPGPRHATLTVPTSAGATSVPLDATGGLGSSDWNVTFTYSDPPQTEHLVMRSVSEGNSSYGIVTQAHEPQPDGTYLLWDADMFSHDGSPLKAGTTYQYSSALNPPFSMDLSRGTEACVINSGSVTFNDLAYAGPDQIMNRMDANLYAACQRNPPWTVSARMRFHARSDITPPGPVTGLTAVRNGGNVTLTWTNPSDSDLAGVMVRWYAGGVAPSVWSAGNTAYLGTGSSASFAAPATGPVSVSVFTWDTTGNVSSATSAYLVDGVPAVAKISPTVSAVGTPVTITGSGFVPGQTTVRFGGYASGHVTVVSSTQLTANVPARPLGTVDVTVTTAGGTSQTSSADRFTYRPLIATAVDLGTGGYWLTTPAGDVYRFNATSLGSLAGKALPAPVVAMAADPLSDGYWLVTSKGNVYNFDAPWYGSLAGKTLPAPVVAIIADPATGGYWLVTSKGNVYNFHAPWYGSLAGKSLPAPVVSATSTGAGYLLTTSKGNVYNFHTPWYGSKAGQTLPAPIVSIAAERALGPGYTGGYWLTTSNGNVYNFHAAWYGSLAGKSIPAPVASITAGTPYYNGSGYLLTTKAGNIYNYGTGYYGSPADQG